MSQNVNDQINLAVKVLKPVVELAEGRYYHIRGTEAHVGKSALLEENLAKQLGAIPNEQGNHARYEIWKMVGPKLIHALHHVGTCGSNAYEATAVYKELVETYTEAARWKQRPPDLIIRSHRHRCIEAKMPTADIDGEGVSNAMVIVTPAWQGKTPFAWKIAGARNSLPQFGGIVIRYKDGELFVRSYVKCVTRSKPE
jgi:hypothetical protein